MKIMINYDLIDKVREAKTGFSLHKYAKVVGFVNGIMIPAKLLGSSLAGQPLVETVGEIFGLFAYSLWCNGAISFGYSFLRKGKAIEELTELSSKLNYICVETDVELLKQSYKYDSEYRINFDSFPPKIEQKKYIMVPVNNDWGNNERSLVQEHVIGTREYALSYGEPEKKKVYSYKRSRVLSSK